MLITIQKLANKISCPGCQNVQVLDAALLCEIGEEKCKTVCNCQKCGLTMIVQLENDSIEINNPTISDELNMVCDSTAQVCEVKKNKKSA